MVLFQEGNILASFFEKFVVAMILYFVVSIINSLAQSHHKRLHKQARGLKKSTDWWDHIYSCHTKT
jgi:large-conductance mechanosensitive channel